MKLDLSLHTVYRITSAPRPADDRDVRGNANPAQSIAALIAAHWELAQSPAESFLLSILMRDPSSERLQVLIGATPELPGVRRSVIEPGHFLLPHPPGTVGETVEPLSVEEILTAFPCWVRCSGSVDPLWTVTDAGQLDVLRGSFTSYTAHLAHPFVWLLAAQPIPSADIERQILTLEVEMPQLRLRTNAESDRLALARAETRYRELAAARVRGAWSVHVLVGAATSGQCLGTAAMLCAATDIHRLPYALVPDHRVGGFADAWADQTAPTTSKPASSPFLASSELVSVLTSAPEVELPGMQLNATNPFDVTPDETPADSFELGTALDVAYHSAGPMRVTRSTLNRHAFIAGATGSGKSQTTRHLLETLSSAARPVPWLVIEPAKAEYARMAGRLRGVAPVLRIRPGDLLAAPVTLNPLEPAAGFPLQSHLDLVRALFLAAFQAEEPFPQVLSQALTRAYTEAGWDLVTSSPRPEWNPRYRRSEERTPSEPRYPRLNDLQTAARRVVDDIGYGKEVAANVRGFIEVRIGSLLVGTPGRFFRGGHPLDIGRLLSQYAVLELEDITDDQDKAFVMGAVIIRIVEHLRVMHGKDGLDDLAHVTVIEEAHRLLKAVKDGPAAASVELFASLLAEIRAYGEGIVVVEQIPSKLIPDVIKNSALKILHRLPAADDRAAVGGTINLTAPQSENLVSFKPGTAAAAVDGMDRPIMIRVVPGTRRESAETAHRVAPMAGRRSVLCAEDCRATERAACTLPQINDAAHRGMDPLVRIWTEAITIAYLAGLKLPVLSGNVAHQFDGLDTRSLECAVGHAVDLSLASRWNHLRRYIIPEQFEAELFGQLRHQVLTKSARKIEYRRWLAGPYRWTDINRRLQGLVEASQTATTDELTAWRDRSAPVLGNDTTALLASLEQISRRQPRSVLLGDPHATGLAAALRQVIGTFDQESVLLALRQACVGPTTSLSFEIHNGISQEASS